MSCPICQKPTDTKFRPFCSKHCADVDLARWFKGGYSIPSTDPEDMEKAIDAIERGEAGEDDEPTRH